MQINADDLADDVIEIRVSGKPGVDGAMFIEAFHDSIIYGVLVTNYKYGEIYTMKIVCGAGKIGVYCTVTLLRQ
jgi:hypothetical protein